MTTTPIQLDPLVRRFVPAGIKVTSFSEVEPLYRQLSLEVIGSTDELLDWLRNWSELRSVIDEERTQRSVAASCYTTDKAVTGRHLEYVRTISPHVLEWDNKLTRMYYDSPFRPELRSRGYEMLDRVFRNDIELFDERNVSLGVEMRELIHKYDEISSSWSVEFEGEELTLPQMAKFFESGDRELRRRAHEATTEVRLRNREQLDRIFDQLLEHRRRYASNLGMESYREFAFRSKLRDYTPADCEEFHAAIEYAAVPLLRKIYEQRRSELGIERLAPFDLEVDPQGRPPLRPFEETSELLALTSDLFHDIDSRLGVRFDAIADNMDIENRKGKAPGAFQATFREQRRPFIFGNLVGFQKDLSTLVHESGHAIHAIQSRDQELFWLGFPAMEFCEVSSMSQELILLHGLDRFYEDADDRRRATRAQWLGTVHIFCWVAVIDGFQHWIYTNPGHSTAGRRDKFVELYCRFMPVVDWSEGKKEALENFWQRQLHLYHAPFYYIEYAIAQLGALQIYRNYQEDPERAISQLLEAQALAGTVNAKELFEVAGCRFDLGPVLLKELMDMVESELAN